MEKLINSLANGQVPVIWQNKAYPSLRGLGSWRENLMNRIEQLKNFEKAPDEDIKMVYINRLFNPQSYLTAIKQIKGSTEGLELNKLTTVTQVTAMAPTEITSPPPKRDGAYIFGLFVEGARYDYNTKQLEDSLPKQMFSLVPVIWCRATLIQEGKITKFGWSHDRTVYVCPVYKTCFRLRQFVFEAQFSTKKDPRKWILAGVACILDVEGVSEVYVKPK